VRGLGKVDRLILVICSCQFFPRYYIIILIIIYFVETYYFIVIVLLVAVNVSRLRTHQNMSVEIGENITLPCQTNFEHPLRWLYIPSQGAPQYVIASGNNVELNYTRKMTVHVDRTNRYYDLSLFDVQLYEQGWYVCMEDSGSVSVHPVLLTVHG